MFVLVLNTGSSSVKFCLLDSKTEQTRLEGQADWSVQPACFSVRQAGLPEQHHNVPLTNPSEAVAHVMTWLVAGQNPLLHNPSEVKAIGHRLVHGGARFRQSVIVTPEVLVQLKELDDLAPLHNPLGRQAIATALKTWPGIPNVVSFDTAFHATLPPVAYTYPLPRQWTEEWGLRRFGFHGLSHSYCARHAPEILGRSIPRLVNCHLGQGCSLAAIRDGVSFDTTMGFTPLDGLMMGTRSGAVDPSILIHVLRHHNLSVDEVEKVLNRESGLLGVSALSRDMRQIEQACQQGNPHAQLALNLFVHRLHQGIAAMTASLGGIDVLAFTAGIGENSASVRAAVCQGLQFLNVFLDSARNATGQADTDIAAVNSPVRVLVIATREDLTILRETVRLVA
jgi:acetate kinase